MTVKKSNLVPILENKINYISTYFEEEIILLNSNKENYFSNLRNCYRYHYTSLESLKSILDTKYFRLMHYSNMNDSSEGSFYLKILLDENILLYDEYQLLMERLDNLYIASFSLFGNRLSQWRNYGEVNIGFDLELMNKIAPQVYKDQDGIFRDSSGLKILECSYIDNFDISQSIVDIKNTVDRLRKYKHDSIDLFILGLLTEAFSIKHKGFEEENEYRIIAYSWKRNHFYNNRLVPYIEYVFEPTAIRRIVIGPSSNSPKIYYNLSMWLKSKPDYKHVELFCSNIPLVK